MLFEKNSGVILMMSDHFCQSNNYLSQRRKGRV